MSLLQWFKLRVIRCTFIIFLFVHIINPEAISQPNKNNKAIKTISISNEAELKSAISLMNQYISGDITLLLSDGVYNLSLLETLLKNNSNFVKEIKAINSHKVDI